MEKKIKKVNMLYALTVIVLPIVILAGIIAILLATFEEHTETIISFSGFAIIIYVIWWVFGISGIYEHKRDRKMKELDQTGFIRNHTFNADGCTVAVDVAHGKIAMVFKWNPGECYAVPVSRITNVWVDDGKVLGGTRRVSFLFIIDGMKIRVNTFTSRHSWSMKSNYVVEALNKANEMVQCLQTAYATAQQNQYWYTKADY